MRKKFIRRDWDRYTKLGKRRKKKQSWRRPTGRHNKMRDKRKGYPEVVSIGYKKEDKGKKMGKTLVRVYSPRELGGIKNHKVVIIGKVGRKKKIEIVKKAKELKISFHNLNLKKFEKRFLSNKNKTEEKK